MQRKDIPTLHEPLPTGLLRQKTRAPRAPRAPRASTMRAFGSRAMCYNPPLRFGPGLTFTSIAPIVRSRRYPVSHVRYPPEEHLSPREQGERAMPTKALYPTVELSPRPSKPRSLTARIAKTAKKAKKARKARTPAPEDSRVHPSRRPRNLEGRTGSPSMVRVKPFEPSNLRTFRTLRTLRRMNQTGGTIARGEPSAT